MAMLPTNTSRFIAPVTFAAFLCVMASLPATQNDTSAAGRITLPQWTANNVALDWQTLDRLMARVPLTDDGQLVVDARTAVALQEGAEGIRQPLTAAYRARVRFLLEQGLSRAAGRELSDLLFRFIQYREAYNQHPQPVTMADREHLQAAFFTPPTANALFQQQNAMQRALAASEDQAKGAEKR